MHDDERYPTAIVTDNYASSGLEVAHQEHVDRQGHDKLLPEEEEKAVQRGDDADKQAYYGTSEKQAVGLPAGDDSAAPPPRTCCCGLKRRTLLIVVAVAAVVMVAAVVGGVVGGLRRARGDSSGGGGGTDKDNDDDVPQPTWTGTGPAPIATGPIQPSQRAVAVSMTMSMSTAKTTNDGETPELQLFYQDLNTTDVFLRRIRDDEARLERRVELTIRPDWGTALAAAAAAFNGSGSGTATATVWTQLFYVSSAGRTNASVVQATLECGGGDDGCATRSNSVVSANVTTHRVNARTRLAALRIGGGGDAGGGGSSSSIVRVYYQAEDGSLSVLNGDRADTKSSGSEGGGGGGGEWTTTLVRTGVHMGSAIVAHGPAKDDLSVYYINSTNQLQFLEYSDILGPNRAQPVKTAPGSSWDPSVSMAGVFVPGLSPRRLFYARPSRGTMVAYYKPVDDAGADFRSSSDPDWGTVDGGLAAAAWARQTRVYYFQGRDLVVSAQNGTRWQKPKVLS
ncbi:hypothetical protein JDV02_006193 [Purpureocillium takamizusanense]|uniref:Fucose-specific lectin n=1 Tax=Purpureocillium takamizusanense TaxID=2060973 RepID=A0A9Q8QIW2_9HYPO|nr:uncharacterized protein JDV02_006193 [Purpureocillium takamizusanense]UNI20067.1 hypothetical protein JDV02_006193 [Purpureocillium takamizusanense]